MAARASSNSWGGFGLGRGYVGSVVNVRLGHSRVRASVASASVHSRPVGLLSRLDALERRIPPAPPPITEAQRDRLARRLVVIYAAEGRAGLVARLTPRLGQDRAGRTADRVGVVLARLEAGR